MSGKDRVAVFFILSGAWFLHRAGIASDEQTAWAKEVIGTILFFVGAGGFCFRLK